MKATIVKRLLALDCENTPFWRKEWRNIHRNPFNEMLRGIKFTRKIAFSHSISLTEFLIKKLENAGFIIKTINIMNGNLPSKDAADNLLIDNIKDEIMQFLEKYVNDNNKIIEIVLVSSDTELILNATKIFINHPKIRWSIIWQEGKSSPYLINTLCIENNVLVIKNINFYRWNPLDDKYVTFSALNKNIEGINNIPKL